MANVASAGALSAAVQVTPSRERSTSKLSSELELSLQARSTEFAVGFPAVRFPGALGAVRTWTVM